MGGHQTTFIGGNVDVGIVDWLQKVEGGRMSSERVDGEQVSSINSISEELEAC